MYIYLYIKYIYTYNTYMKSTFSQVFSRSYMLGQCGTLVALHELTFGGGNKCFFLRLLPTFISS